MGFSNAGGWIWDASGGTRLLNTIVPSGWNINNAIGISDTGLILATGSYNGGSQEYVELSAHSATPEPGTILLVCAGIVLIVAVRKRRVGARA